MVEVRGSFGIVDVGVGDTVGVSVVSGIVAVTVGVGAAVSPDLTVAVGIGWVGTASVVSSSLHHYIQSSIATAWQ
ncbi:MAG: hypothetical protein HQ553_18830 [Chloroflexi bacterium]|nr:hypothetical protein [Chloroflexota bacterium]